MISLTYLFEYGFNRPWSSQNKFKLRKSKLPGTPLNPIRRNLGRVGILSRKLGRMVKPNTRVV